MTEELYGYVYILEVSDIDLPVCKIGMTTRDPVARCHEINKSSTGDFIWAVAYSMAVNDCKKFEKLLHHKLTPLRQKRREFFNLNADDAYKAAISILDAQDDITLVRDYDSAVVYEGKAKSKMKNRYSAHSRHHSVEFADLLQSFCEALGVKGRAFGQLNKPFFGMSDGYEGVQWNISVNTQTDNISIGVNLEGMMYKDWPIARLIRTELTNPELLNVIPQLENPDVIFMTFSRDAWQVASRPEIKEKYIGGKSFSLSELTYENWHSILVEAQECLDQKYDYQRRNTQDVTLIKKDGHHVVRAMPVSPHLTIWSPLLINGSVEESIKNKIAQLNLIYLWMVKRAC
ncbi:GIY-YIG nuclease family protein [Kluyvera cryocrescens]|nr:GIY-YIG nuclease family protein [Kluyvera cryocrescens]